MYTSQLTMNIIMKNPSLNKVRTLSTIFRLVLAACLAVVLSDCGEPDMIYEGTASPQHLLRPGWTHAPGCQLTV